VIDVNKRMRFVHFKPTIKEIKKLNSQNRRFNCIPSRRNSATISNLSKGRFGIYHPQLKRARFAYRSQIQLILLPLVGLINKVIA